MKVHMAVVIASHEGGLGMYTVYSIIPSYPAGNKKVVAILLVSHSLVPRPRPAFRRLQYGRKAGRGLGTRLSQP